MKMDLAVNDGRVKNGKVTDPDIGVILQCPDRAFFIFRKNGHDRNGDFRKKRSAGTRSHNEVVFSRVWENPNKRGAGETGENASGSPRSPACAWNC